ncbi:TrmH family RNA methyltransferase [Sphingomonas sp. BK481]|jgi:tRNA/rRNA methyltransferase|uniref:TrmH family RNA methyltransferase n=1 Tax=Sphingomonas sp. BK481 TaxID=2586981 RepID=UPI001617EC74|nr:TrmH family RNA methyltransferase [Sphingomonas sp. BK481]MBB3586835.1 tRNA/rRNA methyltransferase [Sphingomonas sp. BK481]
MTFWAYVVRCADDSYYTGHTDDLERRIGQHNLGEIEGYTQTRRPVTLMWSQEFPSRQEALAAEFQIKDWSRNKKEALFRDDWAAVSAAARKPERSESVPRYEVSTGSTSTRDERDGGAATPPPVIILVRPQLGENIGKAARAMLNFGLVEMRLVSPRDGWPNPSAGPAASGADIVLQNAKVYDSVAAATADCAQVFATTVRKRGVTKPVMTPEQAATEIHAAPGRSAILFGPERSGLETDDVAVARTIITVPINPEFGSLNLAQAVILVAYEWSKGLTAERELSQPSINPIMPPAPQEELDGMIGQLDTMLMGAGFFYPPDKIQTTRRTLRTLLTKPGWSSQEIRTMRGVLSSLAGKKPRG